MTRVSEVVSSRDHAVLESGTGTGKTVCALVGALSSLGDQGKRIVYLTRTNAQQRQVMLELREINKRKQIFGLGVQGRRGTCPLLKENPDLRDGNSEELSKLCRDKKDRVLREKEGGCPFYENTLSTSFDQIKSFCIEVLPTVEEFVDYCGSMNICPYELMKEMVPSATVITAPYPYFFNPFIRNSFLEWLNASLEGVVAIIDEAHNLPDYARETRSFTLSERLLDLVVSETNEYGDPKLIDGVSIIDVVNVMEETLQKALEEYLIDEDGLIPPSFLQEELMHSFSATSRSLSVIAKGLLTQGEIIREAKKEHGILPRSYIHSLGGFLEFWMNVDEECFVKLILGGDNPGFKGYCLDPSLATSFLRRCSSSLHMSGTLAPLDEYRDSIGLPSSSWLKAYPSPFPEENRQIFYVDDVTTKYEERESDEEMVQRLQNHVVTLCNVLDRNTIVFFPSYSFMDRFISDGVILRIRKRVYMEERGMSQSQLMDMISEFKDGRGDGQVLFSVIGGRVSEGLDFPAEELEAALLVGIPYPKPTAKQRALLHYYELKFGKGWEYTVKAPTQRKMLQAIGRLIRTERDVGAAFILDRRAQQFSSVVDIKLSENPVADVCNFFESRT